MAAPPHRPRLSLGHVLAFCALGMLAVVSVQLAVFVRTSRESILHAAEKLRVAAARRVETQVVRDLAEASDAVDDLEREINLGTADAADPDSVESALFAEIVNRAHVAEIAFTHARRTGFSSEGDAVIDPEGRWQLSVFRSNGKGAESNVISRKTYPSRGFSVDLRTREKGEGLRESPWAPSGDAPDPTEHATFQTTASESVGGRPIWSDLSYSETDANLPEAKRRVVVSVQKAILDRFGNFVGVVRVALDTCTVDAIARITVDVSDKDDPHRVFVSDTSGRLITRLGPDDEMHEIDDDLRVAPHDAPPAITAALASPFLHQVTEDTPEAGGEIMVGAEKYLVTFRALAGTQDWIAGVVVPESYYTGELERTRDRGLILCALAVALAAIALVFVLRMVRRGLGGIVESAAKMRGFDFSVAPIDAPLRDLYDVLDSLERSKSALRALAKYVPLDLVRQLFRANAEPVAGGELRDLSIMFTDIQGFTELSEKLSPNELAVALGKYFEAMTTSIQGTGGTIDKFIGDAVMALWNAPTPCEQHAKLACAAALRCVEATRKLYSSPEWAGNNALVTRFGIHRDTVMVGSFGAPNRLAYTALGDGVNIAARLESLCKQYGSTILASQTIEQAARDEYEFRVVDVVVVKGRSTGLRVYELLGPKGAVAEATLARARAYGEAFEAYRRREFQAALTVIAQYHDDVPSRILKERCHKYIAEPPPADWDGVYTATSK